MHNSITKVGESLPMEEMISKLHGASGSILVEGKNLINRDKKKQVETASIHSGCEEG